MSRSPVGRWMHEIVQARAARDTDFVGALLQEAGELLLGGELPADVQTITLSYTFFEGEGGSAGEQKGSAARGS